MDHQLINPWIYLTKDQLMLSGTIGLLAGFSLIIVSFFVFIRYRRIKSRSLLYLFIHEFISGLAVMLGTGISPLLGLFYYDSPIVDSWMIGVPLPVINGIWPYFNISWQLASLSLIFLMAFCKSIFFKPSDNIFKIFIFINLFFIVSTAIYGIFIYGLEKNFPGDESSVTIYGNLLYFIISGVAFYALFSYSRQMARYQEDSIIKTGIRLVSLGALILLITNLSFVILNIISFDLVFISYLFSLIGIFVITIGYLMPEKVQRIILTKNVVEAN